MSDQIKQIAERLQGLRDVLERNRKILRFILTHMRDKNSIWLLKEECYLI